MELTYTLSATDRELLSRAMDMAARYFPRSVVSDTCFVISRGLSPDFMDRDHAYLSALVNLAHHVGINLATSESSPDSGPFYFLGCDIITFTAALQGRGEVKYAEAFRALSRAVYPEPGTSAYRVLMGETA